MMGNHANTFNKKERLTGVVRISRLFEKGKSMLVYPVKVVFLETDSNDGYPAKAAFTVSKKNFRKAVKRNLIKRRMREAYRLNKNVFYNKLDDKKLNLMFIYVARDILPFSTIEKSIKAAMDRLVKN